MRFGCGHFVAPEPHAMERAKERKIELTKSTTRPLTTSEQLNQLHSLGWRFDFDLGEWLEPRRWQMEKPSEEITELLLSVAVGELCSSCLKASTMTGERCLRCYGENRTRHPALVQIDVRNNR